MTRAWSGDGGHQDITLVAGSDDRARVDVRVGQCQHLACSLTGTASGTSIQRHDGVSADVLPHDPRPGQRHFTPAGTIRFLGDHVLSIMDKLSFSNDQVEVLP